MLKKFVGESFTVAVISGSEKVYGQEGGGSIKIFRPIFLSYSAENLPRESFTVALNSCTEKIWIRGWGGGVSRFSVEKILSHSAEKSVGESFTVALISGIEKVWMGGGGKLSRFSVQYFCLTVPKLSLGNPLLLH